MNGVVTSLTLFILAVVGLGLHSLGVMEKNTWLRGIGTGISVCVIVVSLVRWLF